MNGRRLQSSMARRSFLVRLGAGVGVLGATLVGSPAKAGRAPGKAPWRPTRHAQDDWLDEIPGQHRVVFDTTMPEGLGLAIQFARNYFVANHDAYGLQDSDLAVVIVVRHRSTPFAFDDAMWAKYGKQFSDQAAFTDPKLGEPFRNRVDLLLDHIFTHVSLQNVYAAPGDGTGTAGRMEALINKGVHFAVCGTSARSVCGIIARATGGKPGAIFNEIRANLIPNARMVPAGIVAVNRAQERGYSYVFTM
jgi:intracellular sulfur oxidation DsrE/DsrF family protein